MIIKVLRDDYSKEDVDAEIIGQLAVHPMIDTPYDWAVTHIATGYAVEYDMTHQAALTVAHKLQALGFDFDGYATYGYRDDAPLLQEAKNCAKKWRGF